MIDNRLLKEASNDDDNRKRKERLGYKCLSTFFCSLRN